MRRSISSGLSRLWPSRAAIFNGTILAGLLALGSSHSVYGQCPPAEPPQAPYSEDFEGLANSSASTASTLANCWNLTKDGFYGWAVDNGGTPSGSTGPSVDNTLGTSAGKYLFLETSSSAVLGDSSYAETPDINIDNLASPELTFYYHKYGQTMGDLHVQIFDGSTYTTELTISGETHTSTTDTWTKATVGLSLYSGAIRVRFIGVRGSNFYGDMAIDDVSIDNPPACASPSNPISSNVTSSSVDLDWTAGDAAATSWEVEYGAPGFTPGSGTTMIVTGTPATTISGLSPNTTYQFLIIEECVNSPGTFSPSIQTQVTTLCAPVATWTENWDSHPTGSSNTSWGCFGKIGSTGFMYPTSSSFAPSSPNYFYMSGNTTSPATLLLPEVTNSGAGTHRLEFSARAGSTLGCLVAVGYVTDINDASTFVPVDSFTVAYTTPSSVYNPYFIDAAGIVPMGRIALQAYSYWYSDDWNWAQIPSCEDPQNIASTAVTSSSASFAWTHSGGNAQSFNVEYGPAGFTPGTGTTMNVMGTSATITGLMPQTSYDVYVQADCGATDGTSMWAGPATALTSCLAASMPYAESFDTWPPACWDISSGAFTMLHYGGDYLEAPFWSNNDVTGYAYSQLIDVTADARVKFRWSHSYSTSYPNDQVLLLARIAGTTTWDTVVNLIGTSFSSPGAGSTTPSADADFVQETHNLSSSYTGNTVELRFDMVSDYGPDVFIDDFLVEAQPSCPDPTGISFSNITGTSADVSWTAVGSATSYNVEYGPAGYAQGTGTTMNVSTNSATLSGLSGLTTYDVYVQSDCGSGQQSPWSLANTFTTACVTAVAPWSDDFQSGTVGRHLDFGNCWTQASTTTPSWEVEDASGFNENSTGTGPLYDNTSFGVAGGNYMYLETSGGYGNSGTLYSPNVDVSNLMVPAIYFYYHMYGATMGTLDVEVTNDGGATWTNVWSLSGQQHAAGGDPWTQAIVPLTGMTGVIQVRFIGTSTTSFTSDMSIDDFSVDEGPSCFPPVSVGASAVSGYQATISWASSETSFDVEYGPSGYTQGTGTTATVTDTFAVLTGLTPVTAYDYYVRTNCAGANSSWVGPLSFTTTVSCPAPTILGGTVSPTQVTINWTAGGPVTDFNYAVMPQGTAPTAADIMSGTTTTATVGGLTDNTPYTFYVRDSCGVGDVSAWSTINFETPCNAQVAPYSQNFDSWSSGTQGVVDCWALSNNNVSGGPYWTARTGQTGSTNTGPSSGNGGAGGYIYLETSVSWDSAATAQSAFVDIQSLTTPQLSFYYHMYGATMGTLTVYVWDGAAWNNMWSISGQQHTSLTDPWTEAVIDLSTLAANGADTIAVMFHGTRNGSFTGDMAIDDFSINEAPACPNPSMSVVSNIDVDAADISWTAGDMNALSWSVEYGPTGFTPGTGTTLNVGMTTISLSGLMAATSYDYYIYESCVAGGLSNAEMGTFSTTVCAAASQCTYTANMTDSYGDGWNGNEIGITQNGVTVATFGSTFTSGSAATETFSLCDGFSSDVVVDVFGSWSSEVGFDIVDPNGMVVFSHASGTNFTGAGQVLGNFTSSCAPPPPPMVCYGLDSIATINAKQGLFRAHFDTLMLSGAGFRLQYMPVGDSASMRSKSIKGPYQGVQNFNVTPWFGQNVAVWLDIDTGNGNWVSQACGDTLFVPCKPQTLQMVEQRSATCAADSVLVRAGYAGGYGAPSILWSNGGTNKRTYASQGETLSVTITDAAGCSVTDSITASTLDNTAVPMNWTLTKNNATTFTGSWDAPALPAGASLIGYRMAYRLRNTQQWTNTTLSADTFASVDFTGSGLPGGNYEFVAFTRYNDGSGAVNSEFTCREAKGYNGSGAKTGNGLLGGSDDSNVSIYPNPTNSTLFVSAEQGAVVTLTDMNGKIIGIQEVDNAEVSFDMSNLAQGVYMIRIQTSSEIVTDQVIRN